MWGLAGVQPHHSETLQSGEVSSHTGLFPCLKLQALKATAMSRNVHCSSVLVRVEYIMTEIPRPSEEAKYRLHPAVLALFVRITGG